MKMEAITSLIKILHKEGLLYWANKIGLQGVSLREYRLQSTTKGTNKHKQIENYLINGIPFEESDNLDKILKPYKIISVEKPINNGFISGRIDLLLFKDGKKIVCDFKSNSDIYLDHKLQLSSYKEIGNYDEIAIINFTDWKIKFLELDTVKYFKIIKHLYVIKKLISELNERL